MQLAASKFLEEPWFRRRSVSPAVVRQEPGRVEERVRSPAALPLAVLPAVLRLAVLRLAQARSAGPPRSARPPASADFLARAVADSPTGPGTRQQRALESLSESFDFRGFRTFLGL
jgi:hypothetical protein